jgi:hypothetical protein
MSNAEAVRLFAMALERRRNENREIITRDLQSYADEFNKRHGLEEGRQQVELASELKPMPML